MDTQLIKTRIVAFLYEAGSLVLFSVLGTLASEEFRSLVTEHFGETIFGSLLLLVLNGIVKHARNLAVINTMGGDNERIIV